MTAVMGRRGRTIEQLRTVNGVAVAFPIMGLAEKIILVGAREVDRSKALA